MNIEKTEIEGVFILTPRVFDDPRGSFFEAVNTDSLKKAGIEFTVAQENCAYSLKAGTIRGLHFQNSPRAQAKIIRCIRGSVMDYAVDLRKGSPTYLRYVSALLSWENKKQLYIPKGFAHGVISLSDDTCIEYFADDFYSPEHDRSVRYDDPDINVDWGRDELILSDKDKNAPLLRDSDCNFSI